MARYTVVTMPGDGIGNQVVPEALRVLKAVGFDRGERNAQELDMNSGGRFMPVTG